MPDTDPNLPQETDPVEQPTPTPAEPSPATPPVDYEKKFKESARENQILSEKLKAQERAGQELTKEPTDSELRTAFPSWDLYDDAQKDFARRTYGAERTARNAMTIAQQMQADREWNTSLELALSNSALQGREQAFRQYASKSQYRNVPMDVLIDAFLGKNGTPPAPKTTPRPGLETGTGGPKTPERPKQISAEDLAILRKTDERAYMEYIKTHTVDVDNL